MKSKIKPSYNIAIMKFRHLLILFRFAFLLPVVALAQNGQGQEPLIQSTELKNYCSKLDKSFKKFGWEQSQCESFKWEHYRNSVLGDPLMWTTFGDVSDEEKPSFKEKDVTVVMCGVHGDEITPVKFCFDLMYYLREAFSDPERVKKDFHNKVVLVAPLVNPDSYFKKKPTRVNARGVDVNRNFPTKDWQLEARQIWMSKFRKDKRRNPGTKSLSEPETVFQVNLIKRFNPDKIVSVHSPLTLLDYDGPSMAATNGLDGNKAQELLIQMSKDASGYKIKDYPFFPGSLGNWAGQERNIPTFTLELPSSDPSKNDEYWKLFKSAMHNAIVHNIRQNIARANEIDDNPANAIPAIPATSPN